MSGNELRCPHGLPVTVGVEKGMPVYLHTHNNEYCAVLNTFSTTPEDVLQTMIRSILDNNEFAQFSQEQGGRFHEFAIIFKRSAEVRTRVYEKIAVLSKNEAHVDLAKKLFLLVVIVLADAQTALSEREFTNLISDFFLCFGLAFKKALAHVSNDDEFSHLKAAVEFQKKYVHNMRKSDTYDISSWAR